LDVARTTNGHGKVCDLSYEELSKFDAAPGESIPLFSEVLDRFGGKCLLNIELKESGIEEAVKTEIISRELDKLSYHQSVIVSAFDQDDNDSDASSSWNQLQVFVPDISIALLATAAKIQKIGESGFVKKAKEYKARAINPEGAGVTSSLVNLAHKEGLLVYVWTVNDPKEIERFKKLGVEGLFSDFVERL